MRSPIPSGQGVSALHFTTAHQLIFQSEQAFNFGGNKIWVFVRDCYCFERGRTHSINQSVFHKNHKKHDQDHRYEITELQSISLSWAKNAACCAGVRRRKVHTVLKFSCDRNINDVRTSNNCQVAGSHGRLKRTTTVLSTTEQHCI